MSEPIPPTPAPETIGPKEIGAQMAALRQQFNLSPQEVSERLHIRARYVSAIEEGRYELMPGKVYARGYVHTYAEFLGLDADKVVAQCFAGELPANAQPIPAIAAARHSTPMARTSISSSRSSRWRGYAVLGAIALVVVLVVSQFNGRDGDTLKVEEPTVAQVPEALLASVRTMVMPLPSNYECLTGDTLLACYSSDEASHVLSHLDTDGFHYGGLPDVSALMNIASEEVPADSDVKPTSENPDSPAVATSPSTTETTNADETNEPGPPHD